MITSRLTDVPGSSRYVDQSVITYSNEAKTELLGVPTDMLNAHGAVSEPWRWRWRTAFACEPAPT
jgi:nicotinamide mononucleotide (NMN) deamidase PncC